MIRRLKAPLLYVLTLSTLVATSPALAFEVQTHAEISQAAFAQSSVSKVLRDLDIDPTKPAYGGVLHGSLSPVRWLRKGAQDEDDTVSLNFARYRNHFYDPYYNRGLSAPLVRGEPAPDWALEDQREFLTQTFSYRDARQAFLTALTAPASGDRETALARTFEVLGHVLHVNQDMASPPHTRNDMHGGFIFLGSKSLYEQVLTQPQVRARLNFNGTPVSGLGLARDYWTAGDGRGLAEFTNRNFVSEGTNFTGLMEGATGKGGYPNPALHLWTDGQGRPFVTVVDIQTQLAPGLRDRQGNLIVGKVTFFANTFQDPITGEALRNERMTTLSLFDRELQQKGQQPLFTLNRYNVEAQAAFLVPRAVGYSAGLLDYFFRGGLDFEIKLDEADPTDPTRLGLVIKNRGMELMDGEFTIYTEDKDGKRASVATANRTAYGGSQSDPVPFTPPRDAEKLILVFQGTLGAEEGAVAGAVKPWVPFVFAIQDSVELLGEEVRVEHYYGDAPGGWIKRYSEAGQQRITGRFVLPGDERPAGKYLKRISVVSGWNSYTRLYLNGQDVGGAEWDRDTSPIQEPTTWALVVNAPTAFQWIGYTCDPVCRRTYIPNLPRYLVLETVAGTKLTTPLVSWQGVLSFSRLDIYETSTRLSGALFFGDGDAEWGADISPGQPIPVTAPHTAVHFIPLEVGGRGVGRDDEGTAIFVSWCGYDCWAKNSFQYYLNLGPGWRRQDEDEPYPTVPEPPFALPPPGVKVKRDYFPKELALFEAFNIRPPDYEISLH